MKNFMDNIGANVGKLGTQVQALRKQSHSDIDNVSAERLEDDISVPNVASMDKQEAIDALLQCIQNYKFKFELVPQIIAHHKQVEASVSKLQLDNNNIKRQAVEKLRNADQSYKELLAKYRETMPLQERFSQSVELISKLRGENEKLERNATLARSGIDPLSSSHAASAYRDVINKMQTQISNYKLQQDEWALQKESLLQKQQRLEEKFRDASGKLAKLETKDGGIGPGVTVEDASVAVRRSEGGGGEELGAILSQQLGRYKRKCGELEDVVNKQKLKMADMERALAQGQALGKSEGGEGAEQEGGSGAVEGAGVVWQQVEAVKAEASKEVEAAKSEAVNLQRRLGDLVAMNDQLKSDMSESDKKCNLLRSHNEKEVATLKADISKVTKEKDQLLDKIKAVETKCSGKSDEIHVLKKQLGEMKQTVSDSQKVMQKVQWQVDAGQQTIEALTTKLETAVTDRQDAQQQLKSANNTINTLEEQHTLTRQQLTATTQQLQQLQSAAATTSTTRAVSDLAPTHDPTVISQHGATEQGDTDGTMLSSQGDTDAQNAQGESSMRNSVRQVLLAIADSGEDGSDVEGAVKQVTERMDSTGLRSLMTNMNKLFSFKSTGSGEGSGGVHEQAAAHVGDEFCDTSALINRNEQLMAEIERLQTELSQVSLTMAQAQSLQHHSTFTKQNNTRTLSTHQVNTLTLIEQAEQYLMSIIDQFQAPADATQQAQHQTQNTADQNQPENQPEAQQEDLPQSATNPEATETSGAAADGDVVEGEGTKGAGLDGDVASGGVMFDGTDLARVVSAVQRIKRLGRQLELHVEARASQSDGGLQSRKSGSEDGSDDQQYTQNLKQEIRELFSDYQRAEQKASDIEQSMLALTAERDNAVKRCEQYMADVSTAKDTLLKMRGMFADKSQGWQNQKKSLETANAALEQGHAKDASVINQLNEKIREMEGAHKSAVKALEDEVKQYKKWLQDAKNKGEGAKAMIISHEKTLSQLRDQLNNEKQKHKEVKAKLESAKQYDNDVQRLQQQLETTKRDLAAAQTKQKSLEQDKRAANDEISKLKPKLSVLDQLKKQLDEAKAQIQQQTDKIAQLTPLQDQTARLEASVTKHQQDAARTALQISELEGSISEMTQERDKLSSDLKKERVGREADLSSLRSEVEQLASRPRNLWPEAVLAAVEAAEAAVKKEITAMYQDEHERISADVEEQMEMLRQSASAAERKEQLATQAADELRVRMDAIQNELTSREAALTQQLEGLRQSSSDEITTLRSQLAEALEQADSAQNGREADVDQWKQQYEDACAELESVRCRARAITAVQEEELAGLRVRLAGSSEKRDGGLRGEYGDVLAMSSGTKHESSTRQTHSYDVMRGLGQDDSTYIGGNSGSHVDNVGGGISLSSVGQGVSDVARTTKEEEQGKSEGVQDKLKVRQLVSDDGSYAMDDIRISDSGYSDDWEAAHRGQSSSQSQVNPGYAQVRTHTVSTIQEDVGTSSSVEGSGGVGAGVNQQVQGRVHGVQVNRQQSEIVELGAQGEGVSGSYPMQTPGVVSGSKEGNLQLQCIKLAKENAALKREIQDQDHTHELRTLSESVLKKEIDSLRRAVDYNKVDVSYIRGVLLSAFESGELPVGGQILVVLSRLLEFSSDDMDKIKKARSKQQAGVKGGLLPTKLLSGWQNPGHK